MTFDIFLHYFEYFATAIAFIYVIFQILQKPLMWYLAILAAMCYALVYQHNGLYAMALVQCYLICAGIYGLVDWTRSKKEASKTENEGRILIRPFQYSVGAVSLLLSVAVFFVLHRFLAFKASPDDFAWRPWADAFMATGTMLATFFTGRRYIVSWVMWFVLDSISVGIYLLLGMYPTALLFSLYVIMAVIGFTNWKKNGVLEK